jgi:hypothetical protein
VTHVVCASCAYVNFYRPNLVDQCVIFFLRGQNITNTDMSQLRRQFRNCTILGMYFFRVGLPSPILSRRHNDPLLATDSTDNAWAVMHFCGGIEAALSQKQLV